jgi:hypothetical protein
MNESKWKPNKPPLRRSTAAVSVSFSSIFPSLFLVETTKERTTELCRVYKGEEFESRGKTAKNEVTTGKVGIIRDAA